MSVTVTTNFPPLAGIEFFSTEDMRRLGDDIIQDIRERTRTGVDANGRPFQRYSDRYAQTKGAYLTGANAWANVVDLTLTGEMLRAMHVVSASPTHVKVGWVG